MRLALAQLNLTVGAFADTYRQAADAIGRARAEGCELVLFSELATTGYPPRDLLNHESFVRANLELLDALAALTDEHLGLVVGCVTPNTSNTGKPLYNTAALCHRGQVVGRHHKTLLPTYDVFDEDRYFEPGRTLETFAFKGRRLGLTVCEEVWNDPDFWPRRLYPTDPVCDLAAKGADLLINISSSPFTIGKSAIRLEMIRQEAAKNRVPFFYLNQVGGNDELVFDGQSLAFDAEGRLVVRAKAFEPDLVVCDAPPPGESWKAAPALAPAADSPEAEALAALTLGLRDYVRKCGFRSVVLGLSGGIDSAVTACLAAEALGPAQVTGVAMPTRFSSEHSLRDAEALARALGIRYEVINIDGIFQSYLDALAPVFAGRRADVTEENIQARVRGGVLMALSNKFGSMLLTTGNKSELAVGYCTLYGDMAGGLAVISDVPKTFVYRLARYINERAGTQVIPESSLTKPPSAELRPNQTDQDSLPPYDVLDRIVEAYVERHLDFEEIVAMGLDRAEVARVLALIDRNEYKRRQAAPGIKITSKAFGVGRRYPIAAHYGSTLRERTPARS
ncbi:MAG TPA: NAD+ synthase [Vicinamibacterales bacterium]|nr:NAD+ synthase [Vicinamibacterales bacterium]